MLANHAIAWMLTYLLHSTLLLGVAWLVSKPLSRWSVAAEESVWKLALVGALFTASLQLAAAGWEPLAGRWGMADLPVSAAAYVEEGSAPSREVTIPAVRAQASRVEAVPAPPAPAPEAFRLSLPSLPALGLGVWALGASLLLAGYGASFLRLRRRLRPRPRVVGGTLFSQLRMMALEAGIVEEVRLSCSSRVPVPLALGLRRGEICVPPRALAGLTNEQQEGMLAHELAHLVRRDPFWLFLSHILSSVFFFQPLNWVARRRMREISEVLSDEWAVSRTGRPLSLAGCLAEVAAWSVAPRALPVPSMADRPSHLGQRIHRLLDDTRSPERPARRWWLAAAMAVLVIAVAAAAPAISADRPDSPEPEEAVAVASLDAAVASEPPAGEEERSVTSDRQRQEDEDFEYDEEKFEKAFEETLSKFDKELELEFEFPYEYEYEYELDKELEFDFPAELGGTVSLLSEDFELERIADAAVAEALSHMDSTLAGMDRQLSDDKSRRTLTPAEREELERNIERSIQEAHRVTERVEKELRPRMEKLSREMNEKMSRFNSAEMEKLAAEMAKLAERMRPSPEEMARLQAEVRKLREDDHRLSAQERERIGREAREMARRMRPSEEDREKMRALREEMMKHRLETRDKVLEEHREELDRARREMREEIERHMQGVREEVRRSMDQRRRHLRESGEDRERQRKQRLEERQRERRDRDREDGEKDSSGPSL